MRTAPRCGASRRARCASISGGTAGLLQSCAGASLSRRQPSAHTHGASVPQEGLQSTALDVGVFWVGLFAPSLVWFLLGIGSFFRLSFDWLLLILTALALSFANIIGYVRCKKGAHSQPSY